MKRQLWRSAPCAAVVVGAVLLLSEPVAGAATSWRGPSQSEAPKGSKVAACIQEAQKTRPTTWACLGAELTITTVAADGQIQAQSRNVADNTPVDTTAEARTSLDDWDSWCENGSICTRKISNYTVEVKGNGAYGDSNGVIGTVDQIMRQNFNGSRPTWRMAWIWDSGPAIDAFNFHTRCRKSDAFTDSVCGDNPYDPYIVSGSRWRYDFPSQTGYVYNSQTLSGTSNKYHDENYGYFNAGGYSQTWSTGTIHTGRWKNCPACSYYQVPWTSSP